jgi:hypothetical protein
MGEEAECILRSVKFRRESDPRRAFWPAFGVTGTFDDWYGSTMGAVVISLEHLELSPNQCGNPKLTLSDAWVLMDNHWKDCRRYLRFSGCTPSKKNTLHI